MNGNTIFITDEGYAEELDFNDLPVGYECPYCGTVFTKKSNYKFCPYCAKAC